MKLPQLIFRAGLILSMSFIVSFSSAVFFFNFSGYETLTDRALLVFVPTFAIAYLLFQISGPLQTWLAQRQIRVLSFLGALSILGGMAAVLPAVSTIYYLGWISFSLALFALILPAAPYIEKIQNRLWDYSLGFLWTSSFAYLAIGFLDSAIPSTLSLILLTMILILPGSVFASRLVPRISRSLRAGFLSNPINLILSLVLPIFIFTLIYLVAQFPAIFPLDYIFIPSTWFNAFIASAIVAGVWGIPLSNQYGTRNILRRIKQTSLYKLIEDNLPGAYAAATFFLINLIIARALNHPALTVNTVLFESDAGPWMTILASPEGDYINRSVHPLILITARPLIRLAAAFMGGQWHLAAMIVIASFSGLCVFMAWLFVKRAAGHGTYAFIFSILLGSTAAHLFFGSLTDTYVFGMTSLIFFFLLVQKREQHFSVLVPAGVLVFGVTITNIAQGIIGLFFTRFGFTRLVRLCVAILFFGILLTVLASAIYPNHQTFFYVPGDIAFEGNFVKPMNDSPAQSLLDRLQLTSRSMLLYGIVAPRPLEVVADKPPRPTIDLKTFDTANHIYASYKGHANIPLGMWLILLAGALLFFIKDFQSSGHTP
ncbi:MAG: hypothetical protein HYZ23_00710, partial [Chloroflexi bacterium]|nr:hypothetical protein [Chloroflexota bacterium]